MNIDTLSNKYNTQQGGSLIETLIVLPLLILVTFTVYDYSRYLETYWTFQQAASEGMKVMSRLASAPRSDFNNTYKFYSNETNLISSENDYSNCYEQWSNGNYECKHKVVQWVIRKVLESQERWDNEADLSIRTNANIERAYITISSKYYPIIDVFNLVSLKIECNEVATIFEKKI